MNRRTLLRTSAAAVGGGAAALAGVSIAGDSRADTALTLDVGGDAATLDADDSLAAVTLELSVEWAYDLPASAAPDTVVVEIAAGEADGDVMVVDSADSAQLFTAADGSESFEVDLLDTDALAAASLTPESGEQTTAVAVEARLRVLDADDTLLAHETARDTATISVDRDAVDPDAHGSIGGSGSLTLAVE